MALQVEQRTTSIPNADAHVPVGHAVGTVPNQNSSLLLFGKVSDSRVALRPLGRHLHIPVRDSMATEQLANLVCKWLPVVPLFSHGLLFRGPRGCYTSAVVDALVVCDLLIASTRRHREAVTVLCRLFLPRILVFDEFLAAWSGYGMGGSDIALCGGRMGSRVIFVRN